MSLRERAVHGVIWLSSSTALGVVINLAQTVALARLLEARDFGLTTMVWVVAGFAQLLADVGVGNAVVQRQGLTKEQLSSVYWLNAGSGSIIALVIWLSSPLLVAYYREPDLAGLVPWVAVTCVVVSLGQQFVALSQRELQFHAIAVADVLASVAGFLVAVTSAWLQAGAYALVFGGLAAAVARLLWLGRVMWSTWHPALHFRPSDLTGLLRFGLFQMGDRFANYVWTNADYVLVGRFLGSSSLGFYRLAYEVVVRPLSTVNPILNLVAYPVFAKRQHDDERLRAGFLEMVRLVATVVGPLMAGLCAVAPLAVDVVFGAKWSRAAVLIQVLSPLGILRSLLNPVSSVLLAKGYVGRLFSLNLVLAVVLPPAYWLVVPSGVEALAWTAVVLLAVLMAAMWKPFCGDVLELRWGRYCSAVGKPLALSWLMAACVWATRLATTELHPGPLPHLVALVVFGVLVYGSFLWTLDRRYVETLRGYFRGRSGKASEAMSAQPDQLV